jgi:hypothetical protein
LLFSGGLIDGLVAVAEPPPCLLGRDGIQRPADGFDKHPFVRVPVTAASTLSLRSFE